MSDIIKTQRSLAIKAKYQKEHQFDHLYRLICREDWIKDALNTILSNQGAKTAGIDGLTKKALESETAKAEFAKELETELRQKRFRPMPVRRIYIPKSNGKTRPLGISVNQPEKPLSNQTWMGNAENASWRELKEKIKAERGAKCELCGSLGKLDLHHIISRKNKGKDTEDNLQLLCRACHAQTPSFGRR